jgi:hypothetical protein
MLPALNMKLVKKKKKNNNSGASKSFLVGKLSAYTNLMIKV